MIVCLSKLKKPNMVLPDKGFYFNIKFLRRTEKCGQDPKEVPGQRIGQIINILPDDFRSWKFIQALLTPMIRHSENKIVM